MDFYDVKWKRSAQKELKSLDRQVIPKILAAVEALANNAYPSSAKKLVGQSIPTGSFMTLSHQRSSLKLFEYVTAKRLIYSSMIFPHFHGQITLRVWPRMQLGLNPA